MTGNNLEIISQIDLWYENSFRINCNERSMIQNKISKSRQKTC